MHILILARDIVTFEVILQSLWAAQRYVPHMIMIYYFVPRAMLMCA